MNPSEKSAHERSDASAAGIAWTAFAFLIFAAISSLALNGLFFSSERKDLEKASPTMAPELARRRQRPPEPRLQVQPNVDLSAYLSAENRKLKTYGWIDRNHKTARIPIDLAMRKIVEKGAARK